MPIIITRVPRPPAPKTDGVTSPAAPAFLSGRSRGGVGNYTVPLTAPNAATSTVETRLGLAYHACRYCGHEYLYSCDDQEQKACSNFPRGGKPGDRLKPKKE